MKRKLTLLAIIMILIAIFSGCATVEIDASIAPDNFVSYSYTLVFSNLDSEDPNYNQLRLFILDMQEYWEKNGVACDTSITESSISLKGTIQQQCASQEEAFNTLYEYMTNEISPYDNVTLAYNEDNFRTDYSIEADMDFSKVVDQKVYDVHPQIVINDVDEFLNTVKVTAVFTLPSNEGTESMVIESKTLNFDIPIDSPYSIKIDGTINDNEAAAREKQAGARVKRLGAAIAVSVVLAAASLIAIIVMIVIKLSAVRSAKKAKAVEEEEEQEGNQ